MVSGDLSQRARHGEFQAAHAFLQRLRAHAPVLVVPGQSRHRVVEEPARPARPARSSTPSTPRYFGDLTPVLEIPGADHRGCAEQLRRGLRLADLEPAGRRGEGPPAARRRPPGSTRIFAAAPAGAVRILDVPPQRARGAAISRRMGLANWRSAYRRLLATGADVVLCGHDHHEGAGQIEGALAVSTAGTHSFRTRGGRPSVFNLVHDRRRGRCTSSTTAGSRPSAGSSRRTSTRFARQGAPRVAVSVAGGDQGPVSVHDLLAHRLTLLGLRDVDRIRHPHQPHRDGQPDGAAGAPAAPGLRQRAGPGAPRHRAVPEPAASPGGAAAGRARVPRLPGGAARRRRRAGRAPGAAPARATWPCCSGSRALHQRLNRAHFGGSLGADPDPALRPHAHPAGRAGGGSPDRPADRDRHQPAPHRAPSLARGRAHRAARDGAPVAGGDRAARSTTAAASGARRASWGSSPRRRRLAYESAPTARLRRADVTGPRHIAAAGRATIFRLTRGGLMRWTPGGRSSDLEDRRGSSGGSGSAAAACGSARRRGRPAGPQPGLQAELLRPAGRRDGAEPARAAPPGRWPARRRRTSRSSSSPSCSTTPRPPGTAVPASAASPTSTPSWCCSATPSQIGLRLRPGRDRPVLLPGRREGLHRPRLLRRAAAALRRARRLRPGLRARPRARASRPAPARHRGQGARGAAAAPDAGQRALGPRSSCRPTATPASGATRPQQREHPRAGRRRRGTGRRRRRRRRPDPADAGAGRAPRGVHPRLVRAARELVQARLRVRPARGLRHLQES